MSRRIENPSAQRQGGNLRPIGSSLRNEIQVQSAHLGVFADQALDEGGQVRDQQQHLQSAPTTETADRVYVNLKAIDWDSDLIRAAYDCVLDRDRRGNSLLHPG